MPSFSDGTGDRVLVFDQQKNTWMELLRFKREFSHARGFFTALKERIEVLQSLNHDGLSKARSIEWLAGGEGLALVSHHTPGKRLSELTTEARGPQFAQELIGQISPALAALHVHSFNSFHGAITADRIVVTPEGRLILTESALGAGLNALQLPAVRLQSDLHIAVSSDPVTLNARGDLVQLGLVALSLLLGRKLDPADYPVKTKALLDELAASDAAATPEFRAVHEWLGRALQVSSNPFNNGLEAEEAFKQALEAASAAVAAAAVVVAEPQRVEPAKTETAPSLIVEPASEATSPIARLDDHTRNDDNERVEAKRVVSMPLPAASSMPVETPRPKSMFDDEPAARPAAAAPAPLFLEPLTPDQRTKKRQWMTIGFGTLAAAEAAVIAAMFYMMPGYGATSLTLSTPPAIPSALALAAVPTPPQQLAPIPPASIPAPPAAMPTAATSAAATSAPAETPGAPAAAPVAGRVGGVKVASPFELQVFENGTLLGSSAGTIALNEGTHALDLVSDALAFRYRQTVQVKAGQLAPVTITAPNGKININAVPWASVTIDGAAAGDTPLANLSIPIGSHEIVFSHPQFGTQKQTVVVKADGPARVSATMQRSGGGQ
ncbi:MAG TPA: PEGA domain-containing protein [Vicinamibacterales bacterium]|nr:PEGA domain-containing protein [Vicinamibacterales bacterium]